jgi:hypothetical protein
MNDDKFIEILASIQQKKSMKNAENNEATTTIIPPSTAAPSRHLSAMAAFFRFQLFGAVAVRRYDEEMGDIRMGQHGQNTFCGNGTADDHLNLSCATCPSGPDFSLSIDIQERSKKHKIEVGRSPVRSGVKQQRRRRELGRIGENWRESAGH